MQFCVSNASQSLGSLDDIVDACKFPRNFGHVMLVENVNGPTVDNQLKEK